jgi:hypothetical protein
VPDERIEFPTGLQNRCATAELTRLAGDLGRQGGKYHRIIPKTWRLENAVPVALRIM